MNISKVWVRATAALAIISGVIGIGLPIGVMWKYPESYSAMVPYAQAAILGMIGFSTVMVVLGTLRVLGGHKNLFS